MHLNLGASESAAEIWGKLTKRWPNEKYYTHGESDTVKTWRLAVAGLETSYNIVTDTRADKQNPESEG